MAEKKGLKKYSRKELLEMLLLQNKKIEELTNELEQTNFVLKDKKINIESSGTLAEASLKLNNVFEDADKAAKQYLDNIAKYEQQEKEKNEILTKKIEEYEKKIKDLGRGSKHGKEKTNINKRKESLLQPTNKEQEEFQQKENNKTTGKSQNARTRVFERFFKTNKKNTVDKKVTKKSKNKQEKTSKSNRNSKNN